MSNDLISRSALLEEINNFSMRVTGSANAMALVIMDETKKSIMRMVEEQLDVYDVDKVVEQLDNLIKPTEQYRHSFCGTVTDEHCTKYNGCEYCITEQILRIIKSGGIE